MKSVYLAPSQIDAVWDMLKQREPDTSREAAAEVAQMLAEHSAEQEAQEEARIARLLELLLQVRNHVSYTWMIEVLEAAGVDLALFNALIRRRSATKQ
jgi:hypothetical protein